MTATTETATATQVGNTITLEQAITALNRFNQGEFGGGYNFPTDPEHRRGNLPQALVRLFEAHTTEQITMATGSTIREAVISHGYNTSSTDNTAFERMRDAVMAVAGITPAEPEDTSTPEDKATRRATGLRIINESAWPARLWLAGYLGEAYEDTWEGIVETLLYQFDNWSRGVYLTTSEQGRIDQYDRRQQRLGRTDSLSTRAKRIIKVTLNRLHEVAKGATPRDEYPPAPASTEVWTEIVKRWRGVDGANTTSGIGRSHVYWGVSDATYYAGIALEYWTDMLNSGEMTGDVEGRGEFTVENYKWWIDRYTQQGRAEGYGQDELQDVIDGIIIAKGTGMEGATIPEVKSAEALIEYLLTNENNLPDFYIAAVTNGTLDTVDRLREGEKVESLVNTLRREVRKYGYLKFTGRGISRALLETVLTNLRDEVAGKPLSVDEWRARHERFKMAVQYVAGRYGEVQDMCPVLEKATGELGLEPVRKPKRVARLEGDGLVIDVPVETWRDWANGLADHAQRAWRDMSPEQKEAAVVSRVGVHVNWTAMRSAF